MMQAVAFGAGLVALCARPSVSSAQPSSQWRVAYGDSASLSFIDMSRMLRAGHDVVAWVLIMNAKETSGGRGPPFLYVVSKDHFYCAESKVDVPSMVFYNAGGVVVDTATLAKREVVPESEGDRLFQAACSDRYVSAETVPSIDAARQVTAGYVAQMGQTLP